jgi:hypothetical protein
LKILKIIIVSSDHCNVVCPLGIISSIMPYKINKFSSRFKQSIQGNTSEMLSKLRKEWVEVACLAFSYIRKFTLHCDSNMYNEKLLLSTPREGRNQKYR